MHHISYNDNTFHLSYDIGRWEVDTIEIQMTLKLVNYEPFGIDGELFLLKVYESDYIPRKEEKILDDALPNKYLLVKDVTWNFQENKCKLDLSAPEVRVDKQNLNELETCFINNGWSKVE